MPNSHVSIWFSGRQKKINKEGTKKDKRVIVPTPNPQINVQMGHTITPFIFTYVFLPFTKPDMSHFLYSSGAVCFSNLSLFIFRFRENNSFTIYSHGTT